MPSMADLAKSQIEKREAAAERNRRDFPLTATYIDTLTPYFGKPRVVWAEEGGRVIGRKCEN